MALALHLLIMLSLLAPTKRTLEIAQPQLRTEALQVELLSKPVQRSPALTKTSPRAKAAVASPPHAASRAPSHRQPISLTAHAPPNTSANTASTTVVQASPVQTDTLNLNLPASAAGEHRGSYADNGFSDRLKGSSPGSAAALPGRPAGSLVKTIKLDATTSIKNTLEEGGRYMSCSKLEMQRDLNSDYFNVHLQQMYSALGCHR